MDDKNTEASQTYVVILRFPDTEKIIEGSDIVIFQVDFELSKVRIGTRCGHYQSHSFKSMNAENPKKFIFDIIKV